ncbi:mucin-22-like [Hexamita inflata]|uniref:Mucin-22-like n=1 Tax=Hexamita inflata TaxID=28002 RepID=A0AA86TZ23_9EUKA|nr:mucin-22-like [Hexamita inflata]
MLQNISIIGTSLQESQYNGYIVSELGINLQIFVNIVQVCSQFNQSGTESFQLTSSEPITQNCSVCSSQFVVYGLCLNELQNGINIDGVMYCAFPFVFKDSKCVCSAGHEQNGTFCVNTISQLTFLDIQEKVSTTNLNQKISWLSQNVTMEIQTLENSTQTRLKLLDDTLQQQIVTNITTLEGKTNMSILKQELFTNSSFNSLDQFIFNNITSATLKLETQILWNNSYLNSSLLARILLSDLAVVANQTKMEQYVNTTRDTMDQRIISNISALKAQLQGETTIVQNNLISNIVANSSTLELRIIGNSTNVQNNIDALAVSSHNDIEALRSQAYSNLTITSGQLTTNLINNISTLKTYVDAQVLQTELRVIGNFTDIKQHIDSTRDAIDSRLISNITALRSQLQGETNVVQAGLITNIVSNSSVLEQRIISNSSTLQANINSLISSSHADLEALRSQAFSNLTQNQAVTMSAIKYSVQLLNSNFLTIISQNSSIIEQRVIGNFSAHNLTFNHLITQFQVEIQFLLQNLTVNNQQLVNTQSVINNIGTYLCSLISYAHFDSSTGKCVCDVQNTVLSTNMRQCICIIPNTVFSGGQCVCTIPYTTLQSNLCVCNVIPNTVLSGNTCVCTIPFTSIISNKCTCTLPNTLLSGGQCVCTIPYTTLIGTSCTCNIIPYTTLSGANCLCTIPNTAIIDNQCKCTAPNTILQGNQCVSSNSCGVGFKYYCSLTYGAAYSLCCREIYVRNCHEEMYPDGCKEPIQVYCMDNDYDRVYSCKNL